MDKQKLASILRTTFLGLVPLGALLYTMTVLLAYDKGTNYLRAGFDFSLILLTILTVLIAIASVFMGDKPSDASSPFGTNLFFALPAALGFGVGAIFMVIAFAKNQSIWFLVATILLLLSAAHVLLSETDRAIPLLGFAPPIACALLVGILYFDTSIEMNAPLKVVAQCALLPLMLYFTAELRYLIDRAISRLYLALALVSIAASSLCVFSIPVASLAGFLNNSNCLAAALVVLGVNVTILLKLKRFLTPIPSPDENDTKETDAQ